MPRPLQWLTAHQARCTSWFFMSQSHSGKVVWYLNDLIQQMETKNMFALVKAFIVKYLAGMTADEIKSLIEEFAILPQFAPFANIVQDVMAAVKVAESLEEPAVSTPGAAPVASEPATQ